MLKKCFLLLFICFCSNIYGQTKINYGKNDAAGKFYPIRGIKMYAEVYGSGIPLLLIHGNGGSISSMSSIVPYFSQKYKVIVTDSRAHGKSTDAGDSLSFEMMADDEAALLEAMHLDSAYVIGWSDGGIIALEMAMRHPGKVIKLAATGANLWPDSTALIPSFWKGEKQFYDANKSKAFTNAKQKNDWKLFMLDWLQPNIELAALKTIQCPSLIISGDRDLIVLEHSVQIYQNIPKANLWVLPNCSHSTLDEYTDDFNNQVQSFFEKPFHIR